MTNKKLILLSALIVLVITISGICYFLLRDQSAQIPNDLSFQTIEEENYDFWEGNKKLKLIEFIYTHCPDVCPTTTQKMVLLKNDLIQSGVYGSKVELITVTIDPYRDTKEVMTDYAKAFDAYNDENWHFLIGDSTTTKTLANTFQFLYNDPGNGFFTHTTFTYLVDENNHFVSKFPMGEDFNKDKVFETIMNESENIRK